jgi:hypothetical protein
MADGATGVKQPESDKKGAILCKRTKNLSNRKLQAALSTL